MELHPDVQALADAVAELRDALLAKGDEHWARQADLSLQAILKSDAWGANRILGMTSNPKSPLVDSPNPLLDPLVKRVRRQAEKALE